MHFQDLRVKDIHSIILYTTKMKRWVAQNRKDHIVGIILSGASLHDFGYQKFTLYRNCVYFLNQKDNYKVEVNEPGESFSFHFTTYEEIDTDSFCIPLTNPSKAISILEKATIAQNTNNELATLSFLYQFCTEIEQQRQKLHFHKDPRMLSAKTYIDMHFQEDSCFEAAVAESKLTARRFGELFRKTFDVTPNKYIMLRRVDHAKTLLISQIFSVSEVADLCGFSDVYYFSKVFKTLTGVPPSKWNKT